MLVRRADDLALLMTEPRRHEVASLRDLGARGLLLNFLVSQLLLQGEITLLLQPLHYETVFDFDVAKLRAHQLLGGEVLTHVVDFRPVRHCLALR